MGRGKWNGKNENTSEYNKITFFFYYSDKGESEAIEGYCALALFNLFFRPNSY